jgi:hypothetical protein
MRSGSYDPAQELRRVRTLIDQLRTHETRLAGELRRSAEDLRDDRITEDRFHVLMNRQVGFEMFDVNRAFVPPQEVYVAQSGRYVLLGFDSEDKASRVTGSLLAR